MRDLISAWRVRQAAKAGTDLVVVPGRTVLTDEAKDLAARLGVRLRQVEEPDLAPATLTPQEVRADADRVQVVLGSDHGGHELKQELIRALHAAGYSLADVGCHNKDAVDYPDYAAQVAAWVAGGKASRGIMIDTIGVASAMCCNKVPGVRAACCESTTSALSSRRHNNANVLTMGARILAPEEAVKLMLAWLAEPYDGGRHQARVDKMMDLEGVRLGRNRRQF